MTLEEFYAKIGGSLDDVVGRLVSEDRVRKFVFRFPAADDYMKMEKAFAEERYDEAFLYSHNLKGVALNLSFGRLAESASALCETVRHGAPAIDIEPLKKQTAEDYAQLIDAIEELSASQNV